MGACFPPPEPMMPSRNTVVCTICSANYLARSRALMASVATFHRDWDRHVLIADEIGDRFDPATMGQKPACSVMSLVGPALIPSQLGPTGRW